MTPTLWVTLAGIILTFLGTFIGVIVLISKNKFEAGKAQHDWEEAQEKEADRLRDDARRENDVRSSRLWEQMEKQNLEMERRLRDAADERERLAVKALQVAEEAEVAKRAAAKLAEEIELDRGVFMGQLAELQDKQRAYDGLRAHYEEIIANTQAERDAEKERHAGEIAGLVAGHAAEVARLHEVVQRLEIKIAELEGQIKRDTRRRDRADDKTIDKGEGHEQSS